MVNRTHTPRLLAILVVLLSLAPNRAHAQPQPQPPGAGEAKRDAASPEAKPDAPPPEAKPDAPPKDAPPSASADGDAPRPDKPPAPRVPRLHHAPVSVTPAHQDFLVRADIEHPDLVKRALLLYAHSEASTLSEVEFQRSPDGFYVAVVPAEHVKWPRVAYALEIELTTGERRPVFASRDQPHPVLVPEDLMDIRERALDERLGGRRNVFAGSADVVSFGESIADVRDASGNLTQRTVSDSYFRIEGSYTYRPLRVVTEFSVRAGVVRGKSPVALRDPIPGQSEDERFDVGLNYGAPTVRLRAHDLIHFDIELLTSVTEVGFSWGGGGAILIGDPYGSRLTLGMESIQTFGTRFWSRMDVTAGGGVWIAPIVEVTNMPSAEEYGVRLLGEIAADVGGGFRVAGRGGYQARLATSGGAAFGSTLAYAF